MTSGLRSTAVNLASRLVLFLGTAAFFCGAVVEFNKIAWGTGDWWGEFSLKWGVAFILFSLFCVVALFTMGAIIWRRANWLWLSRLFKLRGQLGIFRWLLVLPVIIFPIWLLQYTTWGVVFSGIYIRLLIWMITVVIIGTLLTNNQNIAISPSIFFLTLLLTGAAITLVVPFMKVTSYPFSLGWSEGNRLWDYSLLFGRHLYDFPPDRPPKAYLDIGRQIIGGLPFLLPNVNIFEARLWLAFMEVVPYLILGWIAFWLPEPKTRFLSISAGLWAFIFMNQGPIHTPLLWCAALVAIAWRKPMWLAIPLVIASSYFAQASRDTYAFAPAMWAGMLTLSNVPLDHMRLRALNWGRTVAVVIAGLIGGLLIPILLSQWKWLWALVQAGGIPGKVPAPSPGGVMLFSLPQILTRQPLLWYRLFPNATYGNGILIGLLIAAGPLILILGYLAATRRWTLNLWQMLAIALSLLAFLAVGLVVSTKIGGGGDLHNTDMFLIGMMFAAALAWRAGGPRWLDSATRSWKWMQVTLVLLVALPVVHPLMSMYPLSFANDIERLVTLVDISTPVSVQNPKMLELLDSLPSDATTEFDLETIRESVKSAQSQGEVLFMDQRQLLTFGFIQNVPLVSEYEKKLMMDEALSDNAAYFERFYQDLASKRFSLIITDPLRAPIKDSDFQFGEENNAWVQWVAKPVLCYYQPIVDITEVHVQLLIPQPGLPDCSASLPLGR
jgi:hypothetical protein